MSGLEWKGSPGHVIASGDTGMFSIQTVGAQYVLQAIEGDRIRAALGFLGKTFLTLEAAKIVAQALEDGA